MQSGNGFWQRGQSATTPALAATSAGLEAGVEPGFDMVPPIRQRAEGFNTMPKRPAWASWNFLPWPRQDHALNDAAVTYWIRNAHGAAALYVGKIMHARLKPFGHRFRYCVMSLLIDLDRLDEADRQSRLFGVNRAGACSFHEADRGPRDGSSLRAYAQACGQAHDIDLTGGRAAGRPTPVAQGCADRGALRQPMRHAGYSLGAGRNRG
jgi:hypothetical protein